MAKDDRKPVVSQSIMADCPALKPIPKNETQEQGWENRGNDRLAYDECWQLNAAKADVIRTLQDTSK